MKIVDDIWSSGTPVANHRQISMSPTISCAAYRATGLQQKNSRSSRRAQQPVLHDHREISSASCIGADERTSVSFALPPALRTRITQIRSERRMAMQPRSYVMRRGGFPG
jgi:hypothetical protein